MGCTNCGKGNRHASPMKKVPVLVENKDKTTTVITNSGPKVVETPSKPSRKPMLQSDTIEGETPQQAFENAKGMTFEQIKERHMLDQQPMVESSDKFLSEMTLPMKRYHVYSMVGIINCDIMSPMGISPEQAVKALKVVLDRDDFAEIREIYPNLKPQIDERYKEIMERRIIIE